MVIRWREKIMIKLTHKPWAKFIAVIVCILSGIVMIASLAGIVAYYAAIDRSTSGADSFTSGSREEMTDMVYANLSGNYAAYMLESLSNDNYDALDGGNLLYSVVKVPAGDTDASKGEQVYSNNNYDVNPDNYDYVFSGPSAEAHNVQYYYSTRSLCEAMFYHADTYEADTSYVSVLLDGYVFDYEAGKMYAKCGDTYVLLHSIQVDTPESYAEYVWDDNKQAYYSTYNDEKLDASAYDTWIGVSMEDSEYVEPGNQSTSTNHELLFAKSSDIQGEIWDLSADKYVLDGDVLEYEEEPTAQPMYYVYMKVKDAPQAGLTMNNGLTDYYTQASDVINRLNWFWNHMVVFQIVSLLLFVASLVFLSFGAGHRSTDDEIHLRGIDRFPYEIYTVLVSLGIGGGITGNIALFMTALGRMDQTLFVILEFEIAVLWMTLFLALYLSTAVRLKNHCFWRYTLIHYIFLPVRKLLHWLGVSVKKIRQAAKENVSLVWKMELILLGIYLVGIFFIVVTGYAPGVEIVLFTLFMIVSAVVTLWAALQMNRLKEGGKRIAQGDYSQPIDTDNMFWEFKKHAENINEVGNGISLAVDARMKSEHFKTELITNVSHDIKTPLTSIINYVDLIKKEQFDDPKLDEYIDVLDRQSARLKKLIEDLMEASKASTGNLPVHLEKFDASVMLTQVVGEFEERTQANHLDLIVSGPEKPVYILADGRHLWRVFDNLMSNICKYAQPGTRVYINLEQVKQDVVITFRNISRYQLNITSEELMERFVRGDSSRNTEGNGLGLSIAQSLTTLMNGTMRFEVDGDLFKVILTFAQLMDE